MSFASILNTIDQYIKIKPWLQFVGYMILIGGLITIAAKCGMSVGLVIGFLGLGISMAGFNYRDIYP